MFQTTNQLYSLFFGYTMVYPISRPGISHDCPERVHDLIQLRLEIENLRVQASPLHRILRPRGARGEGVDLLIIYCI